MMKDLTRKVSVFEVTALDHAAMEAAVAKKLGNELRPGETVEIRPHWGFVKTGEGTFLIDTDGWGERIPIERIPTKIDVYRVDADGKRARLPQWQFLLDANNVAKYATDQKCRLDDHVKRGATWHDAGVADWEFTLSRSTKRFGGPLSGERVLRLDRLMPEESASLLAQAPAPTKPRTAERIPTMHFTIRETEDATADIKFLTRIRELLDLWPGSDRVRMRIRTRDGGTTDMRWSAEASRSLRIAMAQLVAHRAGLPLIWKGRVLTERIEATLRRGRRHFDARRLTLGALTRAERVDQPPPTELEMVERASMRSIDEEWEFDDISHDAKEAYLEAFGLRRATEEMGDQYIDWYYDYREVFEDALRYGTRTAWAWTE